MQNAQYYIDYLQLEPHPEGGFFCRTYCSAVKVGARNSASMIYYLLKQNDVSAFHRLKSDEIWLHQQGAMVQVYVFDELGVLHSYKLGSNLDADEQLQVVIPANCWFAAELADVSSFALMSCIVTPEFSFQDFELAEKTDLLKKHPRHAVIINRLCKK